jgi:hypothetical protein
VALRLVVIEFRDGSGKVTNSIPTPAQLETYRRAMLSGPSPHAGEPQPRAARRETG